MMSAARKLQSLGFAILLLAILGLIYPLSLQVATTRSDVFQVERDIRRTRENIRYLETELGARASLRQLERWNADVFGYAAPTASQYLAGEQELASMHNRTLKGGMPVVAPVLTAMAATAQQSGAPAQGVPAIAQGLAISQRVDVPKPRTTDATAATRTARTNMAQNASAATAALQIVPAAQAAQPRSSVKSAPSISPAAQARNADQRRAERAAMLEGQLLSPETLAQIERGARIERAARANRPAAPAKAAPTKAAPAKAALAKPMTARSAAAKPVATKPSAVKPSAAKPTKAKP